ncbi:DUF917 domain-containing protein [Shewanella submarina]|uniref:DUF917 domain-containing protein n=1 Tax=Shewanella submarina TaxID=2016376 RepID=A0ABV7G7W8_9GAMM|nr:DUF917 domain-containing protein [Shewanella submarina]MCL1037003.1 DUF917 domain-containing protein [Shewanella submarina]
MINTKQDLQDYARGAALLGAGGGGDPYIGRLLAEQAIDAYGAPTVIQAEALDDDACIISVAMIGAPTVLMEKACSGDDLDHLLEAMARHLGKKVDALMPIEIGGVNSCLPLVAAARTGLPLVDCDGMGRAFPCLEMVTFNVYGCDVFPTVMVDEHGNEIVIRATDAPKTEKFARSVIGEMGLSAMISCYPLSGKQLKRWAVTGTMTLALELGRAIRLGRQSDNPVQSLLDALNSTHYYSPARLLQEGKVVDVERVTRDGFSFGTCRVESQTGYSAIDLSFQNEFLSATNDGGYVATVPDIIAVVDKDTAEPITAETLRYGQRVSVIATNIPPLMRTPEALAVFGPRCFGLNTGYQPHERTTDQLE